MKYRKYSTDNSDVPAEAALKAASFEIGKLKSEIAYLEAELEQKNKAIAAFKRWQKKSAEYHYQYWLVEGIRIMGLEPSDARVKSLHCLLTQHDLFAGRLKTLESTYKNYMKSRAIFAQAHKEELADELQGTEGEMAEGASECHEGGDLGSGLSDLH